MNELTDGQQFFILVGIGLVIWAILLLVEQVLKAKYHRHDWTQFAVRYNAPPKGMTSVQGSQETMELGMFGQSIITQTCEHCNMVRTITVVGDAR